MVFANSTWRADEVALRVLRELLAQDQDAVERRAQLVRHVREELGLVARSERELGGLFLERLAGLLDFLVLALHLGVLLGEQPCLRGHLLVRGCSSTCCACNSPASSWDCFSRPSVRIVASMVFSTTPIEPVSCSRNARCPSGEFVQRRELDDGLDLAFVQHRQHDDVARLRLHQAAAELDRVRRHARQQHALALHGALADEAFAETVAARLGGFA